MNRKGQVALIFGVMMFVFAFITAVVLSEPVNQFVDIARDSDHLNCEATNLSTGSYLTCVAVDLTLPFFIITCILAGAALITHQIGGG
jgi:hypothetical protein